jgi:hypothetical protein
MPRALRLTSWTAERRTLTRVSSGLATSDEQSSPRGSRSSTARSLSDGLSLSANTGAPRSLLTLWPVGELSLTRNPSNPHAVARPLHDAQRRRVVLLADALLLRSRAQTLTRCVPEANARKRLDAASGLGDRSLARMLRFSGPQLSSGRPSVSLGPRVRGAWTCFRETGSPSSLFLSCFSSRRARPRLLARPRLSRRVRPRSLPRSRPSPRTRHLPQAPRPHRPRLHRRARSRYRVHCPASRSRRGRAITTLPDSR